MAGTTLVPPGRQHKRTVSDQQKRRELALQRQKQGRRDLQHHARQLALSAPAEGADAFGQQLGEFVENEVSARSGLGESLLSSFDYLSAVLFFAFLDFVLFLEFVTLVLRLAIVGFLFAAVRFAGVSLRLWLDFSLINEC